PPARPSGGGALHREQPHRYVETLQEAPARRLEAKAAARDPGAERLVDQDLVRDGELGQARGEVHDRPVVVAAPNQDVAHGEAAARRDRSIAREALDEPER